jgi:hypothetical protein
MINHNMWIDIRLWSSPTVYLFNHTIRLLHCGVYSPQTADLV